MVPPQIALSPAAPPILPAPVNSVTYLSFKATLNRLTVIPKRIRILLIDDDAIYSAFLAELVNTVEGLDCELERIAYFDEGLNAVTQQAYDVYLIDYQLNRQDGLELMRQAVQQGACKPMILLTGSGSHELYQQAMTIGAVGYLVKYEVSASLLERIIRHALKHTEDLESLRLSEERYAAAVESAEDGVWDWDLRTNTVYYSTRWKAIIGCTDLEVGYGLHEWHERIHPVDFPQVMADLDGYLRGHRSVFTNEHRIYHRGKEEYLWVRTRGLLIGQSRLVGAMTDITDRKRTEALLVHHAHHDHLTGLPNRLYFMERLRGIYSRCQNPRFAVLFMDLDRFKVVNDSLGHAVGDAVLKRIAERLKRCVEPELIARLGGDEFSVLLEGIENKKQACRVAERLIEALHPPIVLDDHQFNFTVSIGIALNTRNENAEEVLRNADIAMYEAKTHRERHYALFDQAMHRRVHERLQLEEELRDAVATKQAFVLYYQPIVAVSKRTIVGFEALVRWQHPKRGLVAPNAFMPCIEEIGLTVPLTWQILETACRDIRVLHRSTGRFPCTVSVNLSPKQFAQADLIPRLETLLHNAAVPAEALCLEITENMAMDRSSATIDRLNELKQLGVCCHIDDFGTGYSSLSYLHQLPCAGLKIDRSFIENMCTDKTHRAIVRTIITLAHELGMYIIAEGVETEAQFMQLKQMSCDYVQGYLLARPLPLMEAQALLRASEI